jgi:hypothetical protein
MFGGFFGGLGAGGGGRFEASYRCYPVSFIDKTDAERGDKVFLPPSALDRLGESGGRQPRSTRRPSATPPARARPPPAACLPCPLRAAQLHVDYPMLFKVDNRRGGRSTHCGVLEFVADEGVVYMPYWVSCCLLLLPLLLLPLLLLPPLLLLLPPPPLLLERPTGRPAIRAAAAAPSCPHPPTPPPHTHHTTPPSN